MQVSRNWLAQFLPALAQQPQLADMLTDIGIEVESTTAATANLTGVIVGRIHTTRTIPGTRLRSCQVDVGRANDVEVVCGAANARRGLRAPLVLPGTTLPDGRIIATTTIHRVVSHGMLCSPAELGLGDAAGELLELGRSAKAGTLITDLIEADDVVYALSVTPNRGDWLSMLGVAREVAAKLGKKINQPRAPKLKPTLPAATAQIAQAALAHCPKFTCLPLTGVNAKVPTPPLIRERLRRCGVRPISVIVDITNYVMLELGQPLHAFDHAKLQGPITVRSAKQGEQLTLLDGTATNLGEHMLLVCDAAGPQALAGVMGGLASGVTESTTAILLEAAHFVPASVRGRTRELNLNSEAAFRFERGVDSNLCELAIQTAARLIQRTCGGNCGPVTVAGATPAAAPAISLPDGKVNKLTGVEVSVADTRTRLRSLGFTVTRSPRSRTLAVTAPAWRFDIDCAEDLIEEVVRLGGYTELPTTKPALIGTFVPVPETLIAAPAARDRLVADGFHEIVTYAFVPPAWEQACYANDQPLTLANPLAPEQSVMRSGLLGGLLDRAIYNVHHRQVSLRLFEIGRCFPPTGTAQPQRLGMLGWGELAGAHAMPSTANHGFYDMAGTLRRLLPGVNLAYAPLRDHPALHPGRAATVALAGQEIGWLGELHPRLLGKGGYHLSPAPVVCELDFDTLLAMPHERRVQPLSKLPLVRRDLAVVVSAQVPVANLLKSALDQGQEENIVEVTVFDYFAGGKLGEGERSVGIRVVMQGTQANLVEAQINATLAAVTQRLEETCGAKLRT